MSKVTTTGDQWYLYLNHLACRNNPEIFDPFDIDNDYDSQF